MNSYTINNITDNSGITYDYTDYSINKTSDFKSEFNNDNPEINYDIYFRVDVDCYYDILIEGYIVEDYSLHDNHTCLDFYFRELYEQG